jgi:hypothetical protein
MTLLLCDAADAARTFVPGERTSVDVRIVGT